ncbi:hypothetical protein G7077_02715 [Sphingomonas piscis]|uniref:Transcriptional regulator n=1 Tax=Sphingomonas piscis TaxID=2714943 RepID=A0A6G7YML5_9SPHN|nr:hypothetical protein [Sphingomonas piscis]QIK77984.1 hypothetical protein G7077_02715 [Sphingomonas piscis]
MASEEELVAFVASSFRSIWALELLLLLKQEGRACRTEDLVLSLRASPAVIDRALEALVAGGLVTCEDGTCIYMPVTSEVRALVDETEQLYRSKPDRVRRLIVASVNKGLTAFSDAFRLKD